MLEHLGVRTALVPSGGWHYQQPIQDGTTQRIPPSGCAGGDAALVEQVRAFRISARIEIGDVMHDVAEFVRKNSPQNDRIRGREPREPRKRAAGSRAPMIERLRDWLNQIIPKRPKLVSTHEASERAAICAACPRNQKWKVGCIPCCDDVIHKGMNVRRLTEHPEADKLLACYEHSIYLPAAVFVDREHFSPSPNQPLNCWIK